MHEYDTVLKTLLLHTRNSIIEQLTGTVIVRWHNVELPKVGQTRVDLLGETADGELIHIELQSTNDPLMALRMAEYSLLIYRLFGRFPRQIVIYAGHARMNMASELAGPQHVCRYTLVDIRSLDSEPFLRSPWLADNIIAVLTNLRHQRKAVRQILARIATLEAGAREAAFSQLLILAGLRKLGKIVETEVKTMPILDSILDHEVIGPAIRQGLQKGMEQGLQQGMEQGLQQGLQQGRQREGLAIVRGLLEKRFGTLPTAVEQHLTQISIADLEGLSLRLLDAQSLEELFKL